MAGGNKLGTLRKTVGAPSVGDKKEIDYVQTTIGQGTWGAVPGGAEAGKAAGLLGVSALSRDANTRTVWYQIGVDSNGKAFAELGYSVGLREGSLLRDYNHTVTDNTVLKMVPKGQSVDFHFGNNVETLTWDPHSVDWIGSGAPGFDWTDNTKIYWIREQIEAFWGTPSPPSIELPGTSGNPFEFGPAEYRETSTGNVRTIPGNDFSPESGNDPNFRHSSNANKVKLWSSANY